MCGIFNATSNTGATASLNAGGVNLEAISPGAWGNHLKMTITHDDTATTEVAAQQGVEVTDLFNITIEDLKTGSREDYLNVSVVTGPRRLDNILSNLSRLAIVPISFTLPATRPSDGEYIVPEANKTVDGEKIDINNFIGSGFEDQKIGLYALEKVDLFNLLCIPPYTETNDVDPTLIDTAAKYCEDRRAMLIVDPHSDWTNKTKVLKQDESNCLEKYILTRSKNAALFFPRLKQSNPLNDNRMEKFVPCGAVAGIMARTDSQRGVWKAPAGIDATLRGVPELSVKLTNAENGELNPLGVNCLRSFPNIGRVIWGARTLRGADMLADEYKYVPVRRLALFIEETLFRGTQWVVFEPNDEPLWAQIRMNVGSFMHTLFRQGAFQGSSPKEAYFVKCDKDTTPQNDIDRGIVNIVVGFAPLKPAEFVVIKLQQIAGDLEF